MEKIHEKTQIRAMQEITQNRARNYAKLLSCLFVFLFVLISVLPPLAVMAQNASLYLSPSTGTYTVGNTFLVQVKVNSGGVAINAAEGTLIFDPDKLEVVKISKTNSIFSLWVKEPTFSNSLGTIEFAGGKPSPGFTGAAGTILNITFKAKTSGTANLTFAAGSVLADDGKGTNILANTGSGAYRLTTKKITSLPPKEEYIPTPLPAGGVPVAPVISSPTHPNKNQWYSNNDPEFTWKLPSDVTGVSLLLHKKPTANPGPISDGLMESKKYEDMEDGIWYFHIKFKNQYGWGKITHRKVLIDTQPPKPFEIEVQREDPTDPRPILLFDTTDELSGIEYYEVKIGKGNPFPAVTENVKSNPYQLPPQAPGKHSITVKAFDKAGNFSSATTEVEVLPIESPVITKFPKSLGPGQNLILEGRSLPELKIKVFIKKEKKKPIIAETESDEEGRWSFISEEPLEKGNYEVWVQAQDKRGALSLPSSKVSFRVGLPPFLEFGKIAISYTVIMVAFIVLIIGTVMIGFYAWYRVSLWRKRLRKETKEVEESMRRAFNTLRKEVEEQIAILDKKPGLTEEEKKIRDKLQEALDISEESISKEIKDVEKELE